MIDNVIIKVQDVSGNWLDIRIIENLGDRYIRSALVQAKSSYPTKRVKATDSNGMLIDLLD